MPLQAILCMSEMRHCVPGVKFTTFLVVILPFCCVIVETAAPSANAVKSITTPTIGTTPYASFLDVSYSLHSATQKLTDAGDSVAIRLDSESDLVASTIVVSQQAEKTSSSSTNNTEHACQLSESADCSTLPPACLNCSASYNCTYGSSISFTCAAVPTIRCQFSTDSYFLRDGKCEFCYQLPVDHYTCSNATCDSRTPANWYNATCVVRDDVLCLGSRTFKKRRRCNWVAGYRRSSALMWSITLGGFGADRFYLGDWRGGLGKLFSFGGLGVWTIIDIVLIATGYLTPHDGSLYYD